MSRTEYLATAGGRIAYEVDGNGPLVVLSPGVADTRDSYRFLAPLLEKAGYRIAGVDLRGHGESTVGWGSYSRADTAADLVEIIRLLGGPAVIVGQSFSGGSATIAAATEPGLVSAIVEIAPFTRPPAVSLAALLRNANHRRAAFLLGRFALTGNLTNWSKYLHLAYPGSRPADWDSWLSALLANLSEPGRLEAAQKMLRSKPVDAAGRLADVRCPVLIVMGGEDPDFPDPEAEASAIIGLLPSGVGRHTMIENAGHYPHAQFPEEVAAAIVPFLAAHGRA
ncbi:MAG: alpha/beta fold hydrolase [Nocardioides sp.]